ncbi:MAG: hypothetical protein A3F91_08310 [Flavobacteria bacterium RIFCSPLOWO2_12_FULL_35_11]|nr:MAG: hypothetical protein A3F91_08310 [Flavobacteria bacterium RIFCSPLOWO2_12_FULL_35_11]
MLTKKNYMKGNEIWHCDKLFGITTRYIRPCCTWVAVEPMALGKRHSSDTQQDYRYFFYISKKEITYSFMA